MAVGVAVGAMVTAGLGDAVTNADEAEVSCPDPVQATRNATSNPR